MMIDEVHNLVGAGDAEGSIWICIRREMSGSFRFRSELASSMRSMALSGQREMDDYAKERTMLEEKEEKSEEDYARMADLKSRVLQLSTELGALDEKGPPSASHRGTPRIWRPGLAGF